MSAGIVIALVSGGVSLIAAGASYVNARSVTRLNARLEEQRRTRSKQEEAAELRSRFRDPLLSAVFDLQSRLFNVVATRFLVRYSDDPDESARTYAVTSTLYTLAEYLAWVEIIRREIQFLDLGDDTANGRWVRALEAVRNVLARDNLDPTFRVFRGEQRAIGEVMLVPVQGQDGARHLECIGYATFVNHLADPQFARWFQKLRADVDTLAADAESHAERIVLLQDSLVDVLDLLDPDCKRFEADRRSRLTAMT